MYRAQRESLRTKCTRVVSQVFSTGLTGSLNWPWSGSRVMREKKWENDEDDIQTDMPFVEVFDLLCYRFRRTGNGIQWTEKTPKHGMGKLVAG